jgi:CTP:molybdopterin cytidylyltransferase MocA
MASFRDITPVILAAGASARMGRPKALVEFDGRTCLELILDAVGGLGEPVVVLGAAHDEIRKRVPLSAVRVAINPDPARGQTSSLKTGLARLPPSAAAFLFHPVDVPLVTRADVAKLVDSFLGTRDPGKAIFVPSHAMRRGHPVLCRRAVAAEFTALADDAPARDVVVRDPARLVHVVFDAPHVIMDMDTPEDYLTCLTAYRARENSTGLTTKTQSHQGKH